MRADINHHVTRVAMINESKVYFDTRGSTKEHYEKEFFQYIGKGKVFQIGNHKYNLDEEEEEYFFIRRRNEDVIENRKKEDEKRNPLYSFNQFKKSSRQKRNLKCQN